VFEKLSIVDTDLPQIYLHIRATLMGVQSSSGGAVTRPDSDMTAGLHTVLVGRASRVATLVSSNFSIA